MSIRLSACVCVRQDNLENYLELLYEGQDDMSEKIKGTNMILQVG